MIPKGEDVKQARVTMAVIFITAILVSLAFAVLTYDFDNLTLTDDDNNKVNTASVKINTDNGM